ncbi:hypothetical protein EHS25_002778 [Saitozyma podzolica]|uniref:Uncharacterized protein n=1 Tax=Saitozyma podzolica TaxID=1890683 RepID=A0A427YDG3_9TREE|nr:hypothetical protein EHS25_002778 [Saitozyma podzolica]
MSAASDNSNIPVYSGAHDLEKGRGERIERVVTPGGHPADFSQPAIPQQHRKYGNPVPLGLTSFGCGFFLASAFNLYAQGVHTPNVVVPVLILFGGITQSLCGWWEMFLGNTFSATIVGAVSGREQLLKLYSSDRMAHSTSPTAPFTCPNPDGSLRPEFNQAIGLYLMAWMMVTILFIIGSLRSSAGVLTTLVFTALAFLALGIYNMAGLDGGRIAGGVFGMIATAKSAWWTAMAGYWTPDTTFRWIRVNPIDLSRGGD